MAPPASQIQSIFEPLSIQGSQQKFFDHVADDVYWVILGQSPMSGEYHDKQDFAQKTLQYLRDKVLTEPLRLKVVNIISGGADSDWAAVEMKAIDAECKNGLSYNMTYCWTCKFDKQNSKIVEVRAYIDTKLLTDAIEKNP